MLNRKWLEFFLPEAIVSSSQLLWISHWMVHQTPKHKYQNRLATGIWDWDWQSRDNLFHPSLRMQASYPNWRPSEDRWSQDSLQDTAVSSSKGLWQRRKRSWRKDCVAIFLKRVENVIRKREALPWIPFWNLFHDLFRTTWKAFCHICWENKNIDGKEKTITDKRGRDSKEEKKMGAESEGAHGKMREREKGGILNFTC